MNKIIFFVVFFQSLVSVSEAADKLQVLACEPEWAALVEELGGKFIAVKSATVGTQDPHHIQARPSLIAAARRADLLLCTGAELEVGWLPLLQRKSGNPKIQEGADGVFMTTEFVLLKGQPTRLDRSEGDVHAAGNPHISRDPHLILEVAKPLSKRLQLLDSRHSQQYKTLFKNFEQRWKAATLAWEKKALPLRGKRLIVHHDSWLYLSDWLGLKTIATLEPKAGIPPTANHLSQLLKQLQSEPIDMIVYSSYQSSRSANWLGKKAKVPVVALPSTVGSTASATDLFGLFDTLLNSLLEYK